MKNLSRLFAPLDLLSLTALAGEASPIWMRQPAISPDGQSNKNNEPSGKQ